MRLCRLRGVFAATHAVEAWVLHDPRRWLGAAFHRVMQVAARPGPSTKDLEMAWRSAVADAADEAAEHPLDCRFGPPERWPSYFLVRQRALASATQLRSRTNVRSGSKLKATVGAKGTERRIETRDGRLAGRPDFFNGHTIVEYKSSLPDRSSPHATDILEGYRRQLRLYAAILADLESRWPVTAKLIAASGQSMEFHLDPDECMAEAEAAREALEEVNRELSRGTPPATLAKPDSASCRRCPFQVICPAFWKWIEEHSIEDLPAAASVEVVRIDIGHDADIYTANVAVMASSRPIDRHQAIVLRRSTHRDHSNSPKGTRWRIVSGMIRPEARLRANLSTVVILENRVPTFTPASMATSPPVA